MNYDTIIERLEDAKVDPNSHELGIGMTKLGINMRIGFNYGLDQAIAIIKSVKEEHEG